jgi:hypothetical protein
MKLPNTKRYYKDLAHFYFTLGHIQLMIYFRGLATEPKYEHSKKDTRDWFLANGIERPERDEDGQYIFEV